MKRLSLLITAGMFTGLALADGKGTSSITILKEGEVPKGIVHKVSLPPKPEKIERPGVVDVAGDRPQLAAPEKAQGAGISEVVKSEAGQQAGIHVPESVGNEHTENAGRGAAELKGANAEQNPSEQKTPVFEGISVPDRKPESVERGGRPERAEPAARPERPERVEKPDTPERPEKPEKPERPGRN
ncbi:hypothetical protein QP938_11210 [Porticoccaceae bacterium LTM1]|nr:hypothetical protein QP938_11210 [Porticoccaceae bacterium LTM1]